MDTNKIFIDMAQRAHEFAEMCRLMQKIPDMPLTAEVKDALDEYAKRLGLPKADPEAWREEYRKKQAAGVKFQRKSLGEWKDAMKLFDFSWTKESYREAPGQPTIPHAAERALYWKQRAEGTNEDWQYSNLRQDGWVDVMGEPAWMPHNKYRPKPKTRTVYFALAKYEGGRFGSWSRECKDRLVKDIEHSGYIIIGDIEEREIEA